MQEAGALSSFQTGGTPVIDPVNTIAAVHSDLFPIYKAADDGTAATTTAETYTGIFLPQTQGVSTTAGQRLYRLNAIYYVATTGGITGDNTNNAVITVSVRDANGANPVVLGTLTTNVATGNIVQGAGKTFTMATTNPAPLPAGATFTYAITKGGTGVVVRAGVITLDVEAI